MRGFYLKAAQLVSTRDDFLRLGGHSEVPKPRPEVYLEWCRKLQDEVPMSLSSTEARQVICKDGAGLWHVRLCTQTYIHFAYHKSTTIYVTHFFSSGVSV